MSKIDFTIVLALALAAAVAFNSWRGYRRGKVMGRFGTITRRGRPERFHRYMVGNAVVFVCSLGLAMWQLLHR